MVNHTITDISLDLIDPIAGLEDRELNQKHVDSLVVMNEPEKWPPIIVTPREDRYGRIAGKHRIEAAHRLKLSSIKATIREYQSQDEMYVDMWRDNVRNGLSLTTKERKQHAIHLHKLLPQMSSREIARNTGLSHPTVQATIKAAEKTNDQEKEDQEKEKKRFDNLVKKIALSCTDFCEMTEDYGVTESAKMLSDVILRGYYTDEEIDNFEQFFKSMAKVLEEAADMIIEQNSESEEESA